MALRTDHKLFRARAYALENCFVALGETIRDAEFKDVWVDSLRAFSKASSAESASMIQVERVWLPLNQDHGVGVMSCSSLPTP